MSSPPFDAPVHQPPYAQPAHPQPPHGAQPAHPQPPHGAQPPHPQPPHGSGQSEAQDAEENKVWGILAYIIFLVPLLAAPKTSRFARFHTNQGLVLTVGAISVNVILQIAANVVEGGMFTSLDALSTGLSVLRVLNVVQLVLGLGFLAFAVLGIVNAAQGNLKALPGIGSITILKQEARP
jgi:uncharacterized membrane protein